jgi:succinate dehydrogenase / fumarate reductase cytochrome b subunit
MQIRGTRRNAVVGREGALYAFVNTGKVSGMARQDGRMVPHAVKRPLSPHLQIYRPMLTMMMSIAHRITGAALYVGTLLLAWYLLALASGPDAFETAAWFLDSIVGKLVLLGFTWALFNHLLGGIRHFLWDAGYGMDHPQREWLAQGTLIGGLVLTVLVWLVAFLVR